MKSLFKIIFICLLAAGCGNDITGDAFISIHYLDTIEELQALKTPDLQDVMIHGWATWEDDINGNRNCNIYILYPAWYNSEKYYHEVLGHETRHCFEGYFHD